MEIVTEPLPLSLFSSLPPLVRLEDILEDPPPATLKPAAAPEAPEAEEAPTVVMLMPPVPLFAPEPAELVAWELLDVIRTERPVPPGPEDTALSPALREKSPRGQESEGQDNNLQLLSRTKLQHDTMIYYIFLSNIIIEFFS